MVFLKLEKLGVLENGILFIAAVIVLIIILFLLPFLIICMTSRRPYVLALARLSDFSFFDSPSCSFGRSHTVFVLSSNTPHSFLSQDLCFCCFLTGCGLLLLQVSAQGDFLKEPLLDQLL